MNQAANEARWGEIRALVKDGLKFTEEKNTTSLSALHQDDTRCHTEVLRE